MIEPGKIRIIDNKVYFEPDGIEKPKGKSITEFFQAAERFIESKKLIEVKNECEISDLSFIRGW